MSRVFPQHSTFSAGFNRIKNRYFSTNSCSQIRPYCHHFFKFSREKGRRCRPLRQVFALGIPFQIIRLERGQTLVFCRRLYLENKAVSCSGFPGPCAGAAHAQRAPRDSASHHARLDVLVGDLLVVVGAAAGGVHRRGRHGVEREDKLLSVTHAG